MSDVQLQDVEGTIVSNNGKDALVQMMDGNERWFTRKTETAQQFQTTFPVGKTVSFQRLQTTFPVGKTVSYQRGSGDPCELLFGFVEKLGTKEYGAGMLSSEATVGQTFTITKTPSVAVGMILKITETLSVFCSSEPTFAALLKNERVVANVDISNQAGFEKIAGLIAEAVNNERLAAATK